MQSCNIHVHKTSSDKNIRAKALKIPSQKLIICGISERESKQYMHASGKGRQVVPQLDLTVHNLGTGQFVFVGLYCNMHISIIDTFVYL